MFVDELLAAYPDAKVILSEREIESWMASMDKTLYAILNWTSFEYIAPFDSVFTHSSIVPRSDGR